MMVTGYNALEAPSEDIARELSDINATCSSIMHLRLITVTNIHMGERLFLRIKKLLTNDYCYGIRIADYIEEKGEHLYLKVDGSTTKIKIQNKYGQLTARPWWLTVSPIANRGDRVFRA